MSLVASNPFLEPMMIDTPHLLITDDDRAFREMLREAFALRGFRTSLAADGEEAVQIASQTEVHVVLMDLQMPRLTGIEAVRQLKARRSNLPCILISGAVNETVIVQARAVSIFAVHQKPIKLDEVRGSVRQALREAYGWPTTN